MFMMLAIHLRTRVEWVASELSIKMESWFLQNLGSLPIRSLQLGTMGQLLRWVYPESVSLQGLTNA